MSSHTNPLVIPMVEHWRSPKFGSVHVYIRDVRGDYIYHGLREEDQSEDCA